MQEGFLNPNEILSSLNIPDNAIICDFGAGSNGWTVILARMVKKGMVYAVDISDDYLSILESNLKRLDINNVKLLLSDLEKGVKIKEGEIDLLIIANLLFQVNDKEFVLKEGKRILKKKGKLVIVDWKNNNPFGLKEELVDFNKLEESILKIGFKIEKHLDVGNYHRCLIVEKI